jgi:hypothetical protein
MGWQKASGYKRHAIAEMVIGEGRRARPERHRTMEMKAAIHVLNRRTARSRMSPAVCKRTLLPIIFIGGHLDLQDDLANVRRTLATYRAECG